MRERLEAARAGSVAAASAGRARRQAAHRLGDRADVRRRGAAAAADDVDQPAARRTRAASPAMCSGRLVVAAELVGQAGVGMGAHAAPARPGRAPGRTGAELLGAERAVEPDAERARVRDRVPERLGGLARERAPARVGDRAEIMTGTPDAAASRTASRSRRAPPWR